MLRFVFSVAVPTIAYLAFSGPGSPVPATSPALALAPSLAVDNCIEVDPGDTFEVSISVRGVIDLLAWDIYYAYDRQIVEVVGRDVRQLLSREPNSNVFDLSDPVPNRNGVYRIGAADTGGDDAAEDGSGVLTILTLRAIDEGVSWSALVREDRNRDGMYEYGPTLTEVGGTHIGDTNGDGIFDGAVRGGQIAVGRPCKNPAPTPYVDPDVVPVQAVVNTPTVSSEPETGPPDGTTPGPDASRSDATPAPTAEDGGPMDTGSAGRRSSSPEVRGELPPGSGGGSGGGLSPLLATVIGAGGGVAIIGSYFIVRATRRPA